NLGVRRVPRAIAADDHDVGCEHTILNVRVAERKDFAVAVLAVGEALALSRLLAQLTNRVVQLLPKNLVEEHVRLTAREVTLAVDRRKLRRIAEHEELGAERLQIFTDAVVDEAALVDHDELGVLDLARLILGEAWARALALLFGVLQLVDEL